MADWRVPMVVGSVARLGYGLGCALAPGWMSRNRLSPSVLGSPDARMNLRGFGGAHSAIAIHTLLSVRDDHDAGRALRLNTLADTFDAAVSLLERRDRGRFDLMAGGGVAVNVAGIAIAATAAELRRRRGV